MFLGLFDGNPLEVTLQALLCESPGAVDSIMDLCVVVVLVDVEVITFRPVVHGKALR